MPESARAFTRNFTLDTHMVNNDVGIPAVGLPRRAEPFSQAVQFIT